MDNFKPGRKSLTGKLEAQTAEAQQWKDEILDAAMAKVSRVGSDTMRKQYEDGMMDLIGKKNKEAQMEPADPNLAVDGDWPEIVISKAIMQVRNFLGLDEGSDVDSTIEKLVRHELGRPRR